MRAPVRRRLVYSFYRTVSSSGRLARTGADARVSRLSTIVRPYRRNVWRRRLSRELTAELTRERSRALVGVHVIIVAPRHPTSSTVLVARGCVPLAAFGKSQDRRAESPRLLRAYLASFFFSRDSVSSARESVVRETVRAIRSFFAAVRFYLTRGTRVCRRPPCMPPRVCCGASNDRRMREDKRVKTITDRRRGIPE